MCKPKKAWIVINPKTKEYLGYANGEMAVIDQSQHPHIKPFRFHRSEPATHYATQFGMVVCSSRLVQELYSKQQK